MDFFESETENDNLISPLADRMRPGTLDQLAGQEHITKKGELLQRAIENDTLFSIILWGPPGCGKTTIATIIANETKADFIHISAVLSSVKDVREIIKNAEEKRKLYKKRTILFVDEIHRFNKAQQDAFLHHVENGVITLVGATTENPSFEVIPALVSRCRVLSLKALDSNSIKKILTSALNDKDKGLGSLNISFSDKAFDHIADVSEGDARVALSNLETIAVHCSGKSSVSIEDVELCLQKKAIRYDKSGEEHFNLISALHKSLRGSDPDAAIYWLERMLQGGEDPIYILRRMVRFATEDIGIADPGALTVALNAMESFRFLGRPEGDEAIFQAAIYLATAPKSNAVYTAAKKVRAKIKQTGYLPVPLHIRNAPTGLMEEMGYGKGYKYSHDYKDGYASQEYLPDELSNERFYSPTDRGYENVVKKRLDGWFKIKIKNKKNN
jgi:putative ATPase